jgi:signal transduction histidine kinase/HAMP domain-containing protein
MFGLRQKLALGFGVLFLIMVAIGVQSILNLTKLGESIDVILRENYRSVIACQQMKEALERIDSGLLFVLLGDDRSGGDLILKNQGIFEKALQIELNTITLPGEREKADQLRDLYERYKNSLAAVRDPAAPALQRHDAYFLTLFPLFGQIKTVSDEILQMNQQNMSDANNEARDSAAKARGRMYGLLLLGMMAAATFIVIAGRWILRPIQRLILSTDEIRKGNLDLVVPAGARDEIGHLSESFNAMTASLREFRRSDQAKLLRIQQATQQAFDSLPDIVAVIDPDGKVEVATESAKNIFGLWPEALIMDLPFPWITDIFRRAFMGSRRVTPKDQALIQKFVQGEERYFRPEAVPILNKERGVTGVILYFQDVTQLRQQDELKRDVIRTVSHQLKTPLTSIRMAIHLLLEERIGVLTEKQADLLVAAREDSDRLYGILNNLLDLSRMESGKARLEFQSVSPQSLVMDALEPIRRTAQDQGLNLGAELRGDLPDVWVDPSRIHHVFGNLLSNALKHTSPGGRINVVARAEEETVRFSISDTGTGIPAEYLTKVFEPFFRVPGRGNEQGAGLGLTIAKEIIEAHGGTIEVESREGQETVFTFTLRRADRIGSAENPS